MLLPCARIKLSCLTARSWSAITAPTPSNKVPATTTVRIIGQFSISSSVSNEAATPSARVAAYPSVELRARHFIPAPGKISEAMPALVLADRDPDPFGGGGHVDVVDLVFAPQPIDDRVDHRGTGADRTCLSRALVAARISRTGLVIGFQYT